MRNRILNLLFISICIFQITSCQEEKPLLDSKAVGFVEFSALTEEQSPNISSRQYEENARPAKIVISIHSDLSDTDTITRTQEISLYNLNGYWISEQIALPTGEYQITQFLVLDEAENIIYATPVKGAKLDYLVINPLSISFTVKAEQVTKVVAEVISTTNRVPGDFGFTTFSFKIIDTFDMFITTFKYDTSSANFLPTESHLVVRSEDRTLYNNHLEAKTNQVILQRSFPVYDMTIEKTGFVPYHRSFTSDEIIQYQEASSPLLINLQTDSLASDPSLIAYYPFEGNARDAGPYAFHATYTDAVLTQGKYGSTASAYHFNGIGQRIDIVKSDLPINSQVSVSAWINTSAPTYGMIACKYNWIEDKGFYLYVKEGYANFAGRDNNQKHFKTASTKIVNDGKWHHVVGICNKNIWQIWVDGVLEGEVHSNHQNTDILSNDPLTIGYYFQGNGEGEQQFFNGIIDDIRIYNRVLNEQEIKTLSAY